MLARTNKKETRLILLGVIAVATTIRFWDFPSMQFMHDELSAVIRSQANSFSELIYKTKTTDVHPVGVPIFVHYWTKFFGTDTMIVKLPFIIFGLVSIYYSYKIAEKWFNSTVAILTCAFLATLQFPTMYGQLERPYATGMLFSVLMVWCWTQFFSCLPDRQVSENSKNKYAIGFVLFASLCTYNHYFSLLFAGLVGATGMFFLTKENWKKYLLMCVSVLLLFIPHTSILLFHLSIGGGGEESWLGKPQPDWLITFLKYLFHYSVYVYTLVGILFLAGFYFRNREKKVFDKMRIVALIWALFVPCLAYFYSITKAPVLQFSTFTFSLPFLLMFIFSFYGELKTSIKIAVVCVVMLVNAFTLFAERKHFPLFYKHPYEEMARISDKAVAAFGESKVSVAHFAMEGFVDFYFKKLGRSFKYYRVEKTDPKAFLEYLKNEKTEYFVAGNLPLEFLKLIKEQYPYVISKDEGFTFSVYCFSKNKPANEIKEKVVFSDTQFDAKSNYWDKKYEAHTKGSTPKTFFVGLDGSQEYAPGFTANLYDILSSRHNIINVSVEIQPREETDNPTLVLTIEDGKELLLWRGSEYLWYKKEEGKLNTVYVSNLFSGIDLKNHPYAKMKVFVWNRDKTSLSFRRLEIEVIESNPMIYGLYEPIE